jgi:hypothetical protein
VCLDKYRSLDPNGFFFEETYSIFFLGLKLWMTTRWRMEHNDKALALHRSCICHVFLLCAMIRRTTEFHVIWPLCACFGFHHPGVTCIPLRDRMFAFMSGSTTQERRCSVIVV